MIDLGSYEEATAVVVQPEDGRIVVALQVANSHPNPDKWGVMRVNPDGSPDAGFGTAGRYVTPSGIGPLASAIVRKPDGKFLLGGFGLTFLQFTPQGVPDAGFGNGGMRKLGASETVHDMIAMPDGKLLVAGDDGALPNRNDFLVARYLPDFSPDPSFGTGGRTTTDMTAPDASDFPRDSAAAVAIGRDGRIVLAGGAAPRKFAVARYLGDPFVIDAAKTLHVAATPGADVVTIARGAAGATIDVTVNGEVRTFDTAAVGAIDIDLFAGDDDVTVSSEAAQAATVRGGEGDDTLTIPGTAADNLIGAGASEVTVYVAPSSRRNRTHAGFERVVVQGLGGDDEFGFGNPSSGPAIEALGGDGDDSFELEGDFNVFIDGGTGDADAIEVRSTASGRADFAAGAVSGGGNQFTHANAERLRFVGSMYGDQIYYDVRPPAGVAEPYTLIEPGSGADTVQILRSPPGQFMQVLDYHYQDTVAVWAGAQAYVNTFNIGTVIFEASEGDDQINLTTGTYHDHPTGVITGGGNHVEQNWEFRDVVVRGLGGNDTFRTAPAKINFFDELTVDAGAGDDAVHVGDGLWLGDEIPYVVSGGDGEDALYIDDKGAWYPDAAYQLTDASLGRSYTTRTFEMDSFESVSLRAAEGPNRITVIPSADARLLVDGATPAAQPGDALDLVLVGAEGATLQTSGPGAGLYTFANREPVEFVNIETYAGDTTPPAVAASGFRYATPTQAIIFTFTEDVLASLAPSDLVIRRADGMPVPVSVSGVTYDGQTNTATFALGGPLPDGNYRATFAQGAVTDAAGNALAADFAFDFFHLAADVNRDRSVDFQDLVVVAQNYNGRNTTWAGGDLTGDGKTDFQDLVMLAQRYNTTLPAPTVSAAEVEAPAASAPASAPAFASAMPGTFSTQRVARRPAKVKRLAARA